MSTNLLSKGSSDRQRERIREDSLKDSKFKRQARKKPWKRRPTTSPSLWASSLTTLPTSTFSSTSSILNRCLLEARTRINSDLKSKNYRYSKVYTEFHLTISLLSKVKTGWFTRHVLPLWPRRNQNGYSKPPRGARALSTSSLQEISSSHSFSVAPCNNSGVWLEPCKWLF